MKYGDVSRAAVVALPESAACRRLRLRLRLPAAELDSACCCHALLLVQLLVLVVAVGALARRRRRPSGSGTRKEFSVAIVRVHARTSRRRNDARGDVGGVDEGNVRTADDLAIAPEQVLVCRSVVSCFTCDLQLKYGVTIGLRILSRERWVVESIWLDDHDFGTTTCTVEG